MTWCVLAQPGWALPNGKSVVVYGLLVQDAFSVGSPNRALRTSQVPGRHAIGPGLTAWSANMTRPVTG
jgi:hypothetical protein